jgi:hypothetical protein
MAMKRIEFLAVGLVLLLCAPLAAQSQKPGNIKPSLIEKVLKFPDGSVVTAELRNGETLCGRISGATNQGFRVQYAGSQRIYERDITYDQVKSIGAGDRGPEARGIPTIQERVLRIAAGALVEVRLISGEKTGGYMGPVSAGGFTLKPGQGAADRDLPFTEVKSIQPAEPTEASTQSQGPRTELGATFGQGGFMTAEGNFAAFGAEACLRCQGRVGYFLEYTRWSLTPTGGQTSLLNLAGGGLRIQGKNKYLRPFFDIGIAAGAYNGHPHNYVHRDESFEIVGVVLGVGMTVSLPKGFYVRPQARIAVSPETGVGFASVGFGYRF